MTPAPAAPGVRCYALDLAREEWRGRATLAWVPAELYADLAAIGHEILGPRERETFARFEYERRRTTYLLGRYAAKIALSQLIAVGDISAIDVVPGCFQQPVVIAPVAAPIGVSISHSTRAACAMAFPEEHPMGIDIEEVDPSRAEVMKTQFVDREIAAIGRLGDDALLSAVIWTAKEALSKVLRCGMTVPFELLEVDTLERRGAEVSGAFRNFGQYRFESWVRDGAVVSLVLPRKTRLELEATFLT
jgi:4'-phosphopantetheinyl transferase EntD